MAAGGLDCPHPPLRASLLLVLLEGLMGKQLRPYRPTQRPAGTPSLSSSVPIIGRTNGRPRGLRPTLSHHLNRAMAFAARKFPHIPVLLRVTSTRVGQPAPPRPLATRLRAERDTPRSIQMESDLSPSHSSTPWPSEDLTPTSDRSCSRSPEYPPPISPVSELIRPCGPTRGHARPHTDATAHARSSRAYSPTSDSFTAL